MFVYYVLYFVFFNYFKYYFYNEFFDYTVDKPCLKLKKYKKNKKIVESLFVQK